MWVKWKAGMKLPPEVCFYCGFPLKVIMFSVLERIRLLIRIWIADSLRQ
jgi:hypothetical protein